VLVFIKEAETLEVVVAEEQTKMEKMLLVVKVEMVELV
jgi:hypothetical protein